MPVSSGIRLSISDRLPHAPAIALARVEGSWAHTLNSLHRASHTELRDGAFSSYDRAEA